MCTCIAYGWEWVRGDCMCGQTTITTFVTGKKFLGELLETVPQIIMHVHIYASLHYYRSCSTNNALCACRDFCCSAISCKVTKFVLRENAWDITYLKWGYRLKNPKFLALRKEPIYRKRISLNYSPKANIAKPQCKAIVMLLFKHAAIRFIFSTVVCLALFERWPLATASSECEYGYLNANTLKSEIIQKCRNIIATCRTIHDKLFNGSTVGVCVNATLLSYLYS